MNRGPVLEVPQSRTYVRSCMQLEGSAGPRAFARGHEPNRPSLQYATEEFRVAACLCLRQQIRIGLRASMQPKSSAFP